MIRIVTTIAIVIACLSGCVNSFNGKLNFHIVFWFYTRMKIQKRIGVLTIG